MDLINAQMVKLLAIHDKVAQMATYVAQISPFLAIPDNQAMLNSHDAGSELFQAASSGNVLMVQALLSATGAQTYINLLPRQKAGHRSSLLQKGTLCYCCTALNRFQHRVDVWNNKVFD